jgi:hypothetical protein
MARSAGVVGCSRWCIGGDYDVGGPISSECIHRAGEYPELGGALGNTARQIGFSSRRRETVGSRPLVARVSLVARVPLL